jgi:hypothetical protein
VVAVRCLTSFRAGAGVSERLGGQPVPVVSQNYSSFQGLVAALKEHFAKSGGVT